MLNFEECDQSNCLLSTEISDTTTDLVVLLCCITADMHTLSLLPSHLLFPQPFQSISHNPHILLCCSSTVSVHSISPDTSVLMLDKNNNGISQSLLWKLSDSLQATSSIIIQIINMLQCKCNRLLINYVFTFLHKIVRFSISAYHCIWTWSACWPLSFVILLLFCLLFLSNVFVVVDILSSHKVFLWWIC